MRSTLVWVAGLLVAALPSAARAQGFGPVPTLTAIRLQTTATVPDGGTVTLGGYSRLSEGRTEFGALPGRAFRNVGYGRSATGSRVIIRVRVIDLREEEYRQTGYRSR
jgi:type II secretory pathway component GspD/PulD (secretin)